MTSYNHANDIIDYYGTNQNFGLFYKYVVSEIVTFTSFFFFCQLTLLSDNTKIQ